MAAPTSTPTSTPYDWIKQYPVSLFKLDDVPLLGYSPPFPLDQFALELGRIFQSPDLKIEASDFHWRAADKILEGLGDQQTFLYFNISGLEGTVCWLLSETDIRHIMSLLLNQDDEATHYLDREFLRGFYEFLTLEALQAFSKNELGKSLSPKPVEKDEIVLQESLASDITISLKGRSFTGRLLLSPEFRKAWKEKYAARQLAFPKSGLGEKVRVSLHLEGGKTTMRRSEWAKVKLGDFIILDLCTLDPDADKGRVMITLNHIPLFRAKVKDGNVKLLEHPLFSEDTAMANQPPTPGKGYEDEDLGDEDLDTFDEQIDAELDEDELDAPIQPPRAAPGAAPASARAPLATGVPKAPAAEAPKAEGTPVPSIKTASGKNISTNDIPMNIIIEVGRIEMSVQKLMELQPGNVLELSIRPEDGVDLVVSGRRIAKGELLRLGEALGVRILDIG